MTETIIQEINLRLPVILIPLLPLLGFFLNALFGKKLGHASGWVASLAIIGSFICSLFLPEQPWSSVDLKWIDFLELSGSR